MTKYHQFTKNMKNQCENRATWKFPPSQVHQRKQTGRNCAGLDRGARCSNRRCAMNGVGCVGGEEHVSCTRQSGRPGCGRSDGSARRTHCMNRREIVCERRVASRDVTAAVGSRGRGPSRDWSPPLSATPKYGTDGPFIKVKRRAARDQFSSDSDESNIVTREFCARV